jgi:hypothetical protein
MIPRKRGRDQNDAQQDQEKRESEFGEKAQGKARRLAMASGGVKRQAAKNKLPRPCRQLCM